jgi:hypothetical protein
MCVIRDVRNGKGGDALVTARDLWLRQDPEGGKHKSILRMKQT